MTLFFLKYLDSRPVQREGDYKAPRGGGGGSEYRAPRGDNNDYRPPRSNNDRDYRARNTENGMSRGGGGGSAGTYRAPNGSQPPSRPPPPSSSSSGNAPATAAADATRIRRLEEPKQPVNTPRLFYLFFNSFIDVFFISQVFENRNKFTYLLAEDEGADESDGRDEQ